MIKMTDSRGKKSLTLGFIVLGFVVGNFIAIKAALAGQFMLSDYGMFLSGNLLPWLGREWMEKNNVDS